VFVKPVFGQEHQKIKLIEADSTWGKEVIRIPFWFAPEINYKGYEDIRFAPGWAKVDSTDFWTYAFAWDVNLETKPTSKLYEGHLKDYFDGLMKVVNKDKELSIPKTKATCTEKEKSDNIKCSGRNPLL